MALQFPDIFATILENSHPKGNKSFEQTIIIIGYFTHGKTNEPKSSSYHKLVHGHCGDDNVQCGNGQIIVRADL
jgi:hypothetical protein